MLTRLTFILYESLIISPRNPSNFKRSRKIKHARFSHAANDYSFTKAGGTSNDIAQCCTILRSFASQSSSRIRSDLAKCSCRQETGLSLLQVHAGEQRGRFRWFESRTIREEEDPIGPSLRIFKVEDCTISLKL